MEGEQRPPLGQRHSSQSGARLNVRARNTSAKNLSKLTKITAGHGGAKVMMPRNTSKTNLRKNQSETSLQIHRGQASTSNNAGRDSSSVAKDTAESVQTSHSDNSKRRSIGSGSASKGDPPPSYHAPQLPADRSKQIQQKPPKNKKRSSRDHTASGGKKSRDEQFDFDREELFDDDAWVDEHVETADSAAALKLPEDPTLQSDEAPPGEESPPASTDIQETPISPTPAEQSSNAPNPERRVSFADEIPWPSNQNPNANPSIQIHSAESSRSSQSKVLPPALTDPNATSVHLERDIQAALQASQAADDSGGKGMSPEESREQDIPKQPAPPKVQFALGPTPSSVETPDTAPSTAKSDTGIAASDSDTSRETVVLASKPQPAPSALKPRSVDSDITSESPPTTKKRPTKRVQIEEPVEEFDLSNSNPSTGPATPSIPADTSTAATRTTSFTSFQQYEFLSKSQRDRASIMIQHHPFPPSVWRDNFLNRATPYINDVHSDYTQKFVRRLERRVDNRLKNIMQFQDPLIDAIHRGQEAGVIATFGPEDSASDMDSARSAAGGIGGWFSRLGSGRRDAPKPMSKEQMDAEQLDRWERLVQLYEWELANSAKQPESQERPLTAQTAGTAE